MCDFNSEAIGGALGNLSDTFNKPVSIGNNSTTWGSIGSTAFGAVSAIGKTIATTNNNRSNNAAVEANYNGQLNQLQTQQQQINAQASQQSGKIAMSAMAERSALATSMGEAGVTGNSAQRLDYATRQKANDAQTTIETNRSNQIAQTGSQGLAMRAQANSQMRAGSTDWMSLGMQLAGDGLQFASKLTPITRKNNAAGK